MKKLISLMAAVILLACVLSPGIAGEAPAEETCDAGRVSVPVPAGWSAGPSPTGPDPMSVTLIKGGSDTMALLTCPSIWVSYSPVGMEVLDIREMMGGTGSIEPFSLGGYDWTGFHYDNLGSKGIGLTAVGDFGTLTVNFTPQGMLGGSTISLEDEDVRAILSGITVKPTVELDWVTLNGDGTVTVRLPQPEGSLAWETSMSVSRDLDGDGEGPEAEVAETVADGFYAATITLRGSGAYGQGFILGDGEGQTAQAYVAVLCEDGRATAVTEGHVLEE